MGHLSEDNNRDWIEYVGAVLGYFDVKNFFHNQIRANSLFFHCLRATPYQLNNWYHHYMTEAKYTPPIFNSGARPVTPRMVYTYQRDDVRRLFSKAQLSRASTFSQSPMAEPLITLLESYLGMEGEELGTFLSNLPNSEFLRQFLLSMGITADPELIAEMVSISYYGKKLPVKIVHERDPLEVTRVSVQFGVPIERVYPLNDGQYYEGWFVLDPKSDIPF